MAKKPRKPEPDIAALCRAIERARASGTQAAKIVDNKLRHRSFEAAARYAASLRAISAARKAKREG
jgi:hypothetical protein